MNSKVEDFILIMANCESEEQGKKVLEDYYTGRISVSKKQAEEIVRKKIDEVMAEEIADDEIYAGMDFDEVVRIKLDAIVDLFMKYSLLRFQCGMSKESFKEMLDKIVAEKSCQLSMASNNNSICVDQKKDDETIKRLRKALKEKGQDLDPDIHSVSDLLDSIASIDIDSNVSLVAHTEFTCPHCGKKFPIRSAVLKTKRPRVALYYEKASYKIRYCSQCARKWSVIMRSEIDMFHAAECNAIDS